MFKILFGNTSQIAKSDAARLSLAILVLRVFVGAAMMVHGYGKIQAPFSWMGADAPVPGILQFLAAFSEFFGGLALIIGLLVPLAALGLVITMAVAAVFHIGKGDGFVQGWELAGIYLVSSVFFLLVGSGRYSIDQILRKKIA